MKNKLLSLLLISIVLSSCVDYLDLVPEKDIQTIESIFEKEITALTFLNSCYECAHNTVSTQKNVAICGADEFVVCDYARDKEIERGSYYIESLKLARGLQNSGMPIGNIWGDRLKSGSTPEQNNRYWGIRNCNIFIEKCDKVYDWTLEQKNRYKAEAKALKAYYYLELVMHYGPIVLVSENIDVAADIEEMQLSRQPVDSCFNRIVKLFDEAIPYLTSIAELTKKEVGRFNKEAAYAFKAKARLYQASPLFNGNEWYNNFTNIKGEKLFDPNYNPEKWKLAAEAIDEAVTIAEMNGRKLHDGVLDQPTILRNHIKNIHNCVFNKSFNGTEHIFALWSMSGTDERLRTLRYDPNHYLFYPGAVGILNPSMRMVEMFYTENGLPLNMDKTWNYSERYRMGEEEDAFYKGVVELNEKVLNLHLKREPRFYANIGAQGCYWVRGTYNVLLQPYRGNGVHGIPDKTKLKYSPQNLSGYWSKKYVSDEYGGFYGQLNSSSNPVSVIRLADLYLMQAEAWNEYSGPSDKVFGALNKVRRRAGVPDIVEAWNRYSTSPEKIQNKDGLRDVIWQERNIELAFEGQRFWDLRRWKIAHIELNKNLRGWNVFGENETVFFNNGLGPVVVDPNVKFIFPRDYFFPIRTEETLVSNIVQNPGW